MKENKKKIDVKDIIIFILIIIIVVLFIGLIIAVNDKFSDVDNDNSTTTTNTKMTSLPIKQDIISEDEVAQNIFVDLINDAINKGDKYNIISENLSNDYFSYIKDYRLESFTKYREVNEHSDAREICYDFRVRYLCDDGRDFCWYRGQYLGEVADENGYYLNTGSVTIKENHQITLYSDYSCQIQYDSEI